ncbi:MAG: 23S rRNA pseudouridine(1911/1915/1917) synthase RluD [Acidiferrobacterales bacterium]
MSNEVLHLEIDATMAGRRLDQVLAALLPSYSRVRIQQWIKDGQVTIASQVPRQRDKVSLGQIVEINVPEEEEIPWQAEEIKLNIIFEDEHLIVTEKPAGLVVHPGAGNYSGTLLNALLHHDPGLAKLARAGIVHRLDKNTSGLLVVARNEAARLSLIQQLQDRSLKREYLTVVQGTIIAGGEINQPIGRHFRDRTKMAITPSGKPALTTYRVSEKYRQHTLLKVNLSTGRTHQIRVHMAFIKHPVLGDPVYGGRLKLPKNITEEFRDILTGFKRQALHAQKLGLVHPKTAENMTWESPVPEDMKCLISALKSDSRQ